MQSVIYVCGISLQFRRKRHVLDINFCVVSDISFSREHHTNHTVNFLTSEKMITRRRDLETVESVYRLHHPDSSSHRSALWYYKLFWYCSVPELLLILHWYSRIRSSSGTLVSEARS